MDYLCLPDSPFGHGIHDFLSMMMIVPKVTHDMQSLVFSSVGIEVSESWYETWQSIPSEGSIGKSVSVRILMRIDFSEGSEDKSRNNCDQWSNSWQDKSEYRDDSIELRREQDSI